ncbi:20772_t:CDS:1, partial [Gigaspora rosea]
LVSYGKDLTPQELKDSVNDTIFSNIDKVSFDSNHEFSLSNTQELPPLNIHPQRFKNFCNQVFKNPYHQTFKNSLYQMIKKLLHQKLSNKTDHVLAISEIIDISNFHSNNGQLKPNKLTYNNNIKTSNLFNYSTDDLINRIFEANGDFDFDL